MSINTRRVKTCLQTFDFRRLFIEELNWANCNNPPLRFEIDGQSYCLTPCAQQGGMVIYIGECSTNNEIPPRSTRGKIESQVTKLTHEHMIIFADKDRTKAIWQWVKREHGQSATAREFPYYKGQTGEPLLQKLTGIAFDIDDLDEEGKVAITKVTAKMASSFDIEKVTKRFYAEFDKERKTFLSFLTGLRSQDENEWYVSVMLNRLMFIYFIQKKSFLNNDQDYLVHKLSESKKKGKDLYYSKFLIPLFFEGFAKEKDNRSPEIRQVLGDIPYLNGGIFQKHKLEEENPDIAIPDTDFEHIFAFFNCWDWHLDYRPISHGTEINPDVLGYIFEQYINRKQMGAYYTKEDITGYICKNTIIPCLFDKLTNLDGIKPKLFPLNDIEPYIYPAMKQEEYLPTETDREYAERQQRYQQIKADFREGKIGNTNDLITYNLDIIRFARDWTISIADPRVLWAFYFECLSKVTILDPTVGSGAFLFAALNILEPLYSICLDKMGQVDCNNYPRIAQDFKNELNRVAQHPNRKYFVLKSIIVNNLYGVDIMEEAIEICKLRLFLKLVAQVDDANKIEPLPDIDFNIRAGNSLVGYATYDQTRKAVLGEKQGKMDMEGNMERIDRSAAAVDRAFQDFHAMQTEMGVSARDLAVSKLELQQNLAKLENELNGYLAGEYGIDVKKPVAYEKWVTTHQPFHWFVDFYGIMKNGGFDVIIGNPPYVEYANVNKIYTIKGYKTERCGNLYAFITERSLGLLKTNAWYSMIVPISISCSERMASVRDLVFSSCNIWISNFAIRPQPLFANIMQRNSVFVCQLGKSDRSFCFTTNYLRWTAQEREHLFNRFHFAEVEEFTKEMGIIPKIATDIEIGILHSMMRKGNVKIGQLINNPSEPLYFHDSGESYWTKTLWEKPLAFRDGLAVEPSQWFDLKIPLVDKPFIYLLLNSNLFYWLWTVHTDCRHMTQSFIKGITLPHYREIDGTIINKLKQAYKANTTLFEKRPGYKSPEIKVQNFKSLIDEIDHVLAAHYGFTEEELDFIINYDIKYRMGKDKGEIEEAE